MLIGSTVSCSTANFIKTQLINKKTVFISPSEWVAKYLFCSYWYKIGNTEVRDKDSKLLKPAGDATTKDDSEATKDISLTRYLTTHAYRKMHLKM